MFKPDRIFSNKEGRQKIKEKGVWTTEATEGSECRGWKKVLETTENKKDTELLRGIRGFDLFAREARFHSSCRRQHLRKPTHKRSTNELWHLLTCVNFYLKSALEETKHPKNQVYRAEKREKWHLRAETVILFTAQWGKFKSYFVYNFDMSTDSAVTLAYELSLPHMLQDVALYLKNIIAEAF